ncbi:DUF222 domain-containing protein [Arthrobacter sp. ATA002]|uniref:DUF222 domain-containing protein n=1 Tax=Arthrobacter sp. ATA002 TaxID=2991715 RepID=UPI0022A758C8|nr:DUF222 domain-containing protein [Arthrobacter sp. ATA002]WAP50980.1 DUF222 domain-containing protein [Arthrobacter sp. ATA002]
MQSVFSARGSDCTAARQPGVFVLPVGLSGSLGLRSAGSLDQERTGSALQGLRGLEGWAAAARARLVHRQHQLMAEELERFNRDQAARDAACGLPAVPRRVDRGLAFTLAATEIATMLGIPEGTAKALVDESDELCQRCPGTLAMLERGDISPAQARTILDQTRSLVAEEGPAGAAAAPDTSGGPKAEDGAPARDEDGAGPDGTGAGPDGGAGHGGLLSGAGAGFLQALPVPWK